MASDPTTKDLIEAAREKAHHGWPYTRSDHRTERCPACAIHALADRLEEVEPERITAERVLSLARKEVARLKSRLEEVEEEREAMQPVLRYLYGLARLDGCWYSNDPPEGEGRYWWRKYLRPHISHLGRSPEPSGPDPETSDVPNRAESVGPEPNHVTDTTNLAEDPEPEDDPWTGVKLTAAMEPEGNPAKDNASALLDLRERVEKVATHVRILDLDTAKHRQDNLKRLAALEKRPTVIPSDIQERVNALEWRVEDKALANIAMRNRETLRVLSQVVRETHRRLEDLESHADRGSKAERELRDWMETLKHEVRHACQVRGTLRDDLEKLDDYAENLGERVERLEGWHQDLLDRQHRILNLLNQHGEHLDSILSNARRRANASIGRALRDDGEDAGP